MMDGVSGWVVYRFVGRRGIVASCPRLLHADDFTYRV